MKSSVFGAAVALVVPLTAMAQALPQQKTYLEEALRVQQFICSGIADVGARGGAGYDGDDVVRCQAALQQQQAEYRRFMAQDPSTQAAAAAPAIPSAKTALPGRAFADAMH
ncbi:MAG: hypothetical protein JO032_18145 [Alphaproteobacteria bacterium]|nr:hypothetical protein [Alphaproteobacteria bacterium]